MSEQENVIIPKIGSYNDCIAVVEKESKIPNLLKVLSIIDSQFGVSSVCSTDELIDHALKTNCRQLTALSGYVHLIAAEKMREQGFDTDAMNREVEKAEALLSYANLGQNHPWLSRAKYLRRRVNWKAYGKLVLSVIELAALIIGIGFIARLIRNLDIDISDML